MVCLIEAAKVRIIFGSKVMLLLSFSLESALLALFALDFCLQSTKSKGLPESDPNGLIALVWPGVGFLSGGL
jgi:hypothetical protein